MQQHIKQGGSYFGTEHVHRINFTLSKEKWYFSLMKTFPPSGLHAM